MDGKWHLGSETLVYESDWMTLHTAPAELPDGSSLLHHVIRCGEGGANVLLHDPEKGILMIWRNRPLQDEWGWELPGGRIEAAEKPEVAALRELTEETGWSAENIYEMFSFYPVGAFFDHKFTCFHATDASWVGPGVDQNEVAELQWIPVEKVRELVANKEIHQGLSLAPLTWAFSFGPFASR